MGNEHGIVIKEIWEYDTRTLTQTKFPFWSEVIELYGNLETIPASSTLDIDIQPSSGETWELKAYGTIPNDSVGNFLGFLQTDGTAERYIKVFGTSGDYNPDRVVNDIDVIITNSSYLRMRARNNTSSDLQLQYGYSGFKLGTKIAEFEDVSKIKGKLFERRTKFKIKSEFEGLKDMIFDVYDEMINDYKQVIYFYKDKPIRRDRRTGHVVERASSYIETDIFLKNLEKIRNGELDLKRTGYREWLEKIKKERGIDLLERL